MNDFQERFREFLRQLDHEKLVISHNIVKASKVKEPTIAFLEMMARNPEYVADHERPGTLVVPKYLRFNHAKNAPVIKTALLRAHIVNGETKTDARAYVEIDYGSLAKLFPERQKMSKRDKWMDTHFEQRRCPTAILTYTGEAPLRRYMETLENVMVYFLARYGADGRRLHRTNDGAAIMPRVMDEGSGTYLKTIYSKAATYGSFARYEPQHKIPFSIVTRNLLPYFCNLIQLHYFHDEATTRATTFAFPILDIGKMRFETNGANRGAHYQRIVTVQGREVIKEDTTTTGEWLRHEMADMLAGPMREMGIIPHDFLGGFFGMVDDMRAIIRDGGPFNPRKLSPTHEAFISRLQ